MSPELKKVSRGENPGVYRLNRGDDVNIYFHSQAGPLGGKIGLHNALMEAAKAKGVDMNDLKRQLDKGLTIEW